MNKARVKRVLLALVVFLVVIQSFTAPADQSPRSIFQDLTRPRGRPGRRLLSHDSLLWRLPFKRDALAVVQPCRSLVMGDYR
jgi:hypothetical protein